MIEVTRDSRYKKCGHCDSNKDVLFISIGQEHRRESFKLCMSCSGDLAILIVKKEIEGDPHESS